MLLELFGVGSRRVSRDEVDELLKEFIYPYSNSTVVCRFTDRLTPERRGVYVNRIRNLFFAFRYQSAIQLTARATFIM